MTDLQLCITLSQQCIAVAESGDYLKLCDIMARRDAAYKRLDPYESSAFGSWGKDEFKPEQVAKFLETGDRKHLAITRDTAAHIEIAAEMVAIATRHGDVHEAARLYEGAMRALAQCSDEVTVKAAVDAYMLAVGRRIGAEPCWQLHEAMFRSMESGLRELEPLMTPEQLAQTRSVVEELRAKGVRLPARAEA